MGKITVVIDDQWGRIDNAPADVLAKISEECSFQIKGAEKSDLYKKGRWDGTKKLFNKQSRKFPAGLLGRVMGILGTTPIDIVDDRTPIGSIMNVIDVALSDHVKLRDYQTDAIKHAINNHRSILQVATGGGKTVISAGLINHYKTHTLFLVHTKDLLYQTKASFEENLVGQVIGQLGDGVIDLQSITVATTQTVAKLTGTKFDTLDDTKQKEKDIKGKVDLSQFKLLIWDEVHRSACDMAYNVSQKLTSPVVRIGLSASPWRDDGADIMIESSLGPKRYELSASDLIKRDYLVQPIIKMHPIESSIPWYDDPRTFDTVYAQEVVNNSHRNQVIVDYVREFQGMGLQVLVLVRMIKHGKMLKKMISDQFDPIEFLSGSDLSEHRNLTINRMREKQLMGLIATTIADEGLDIKSLSVVILAGGGKSTTRALQRIGRAIRPSKGKTHALIVDFFDNAKYLRTHAQQRMKMYKTEPQFVVIELGGV
ncbi:helicase [Bacillus phage vB_BpsS-140]|nr:helicase [Bacillus phage vB_BpsS-140]